MSLVLNGGYILGNGTDKEQQTSELLQQSEAALKSRNFEDAIQHARAALALTPDHMRARELMDEAQSKLEAELFVRENLKKADEYFQTREFQKAINECQKIQLLDPDNTEATGLMNRAQEKLEAEPFIQNFINSGQSLFDSGLYSEAVAQWEKVRSIDAAYPSLDKLIQKAKEKMGAPAGAPAASITNMFDLNAVQGSFGEEDAFQIPGAPEEPAEAFGFLSDKERIAHLLKEGDALYGKHQYQKAIETWSEIFMLDANHPDALTKIDEARSAAETQRNEIKEILKNAQIAYDGGNQAEAKDLFMQVKALDPQNAEADHYLGLLEGAAKEPASSQDLIARGDEAEKKSQYREAAQYFSQALAMDSENETLAEKVKSLNILARKQEQTKATLGNARAFFAEGKVESARHALMKVLESEPNNTEAQQLMIELKEAPRAAAAAAPPPPSAAARKMPAPQVGGKSFPVIPAAVIGAILLIGGGYLYYHFHSKSSDPATNIVVAPPVKKPPKKNTTTGSNTSSVVNPLPANVTPEMREKAGKLLVEANFYYSEKKYPEALAKVEEALQNDPENKDAIGLKMQTEKTLKDIAASERKILDDANTYFGYSEFAAAVELYEKYLKLHPETQNQIQPLIIKCYYNLGVLSMKQWRCDMAHDYFRQVLFIDDSDQISKDALALANKCEKVGTGDLEVRKAVALMEIRK